MTDGRATGVAYHDKSGALQTLTARAEVIFSAGAIGSQQVLMYSGIGEGDQLKEQGIPVQRALPGVGKNLQDHLQARLV